MKAVSLLVGLLLSSTAMSNEFSEQLQAHVKDANVWINNDVVINAIKSQNEKHATLKQEDINKLDKSWRAEVDASSSPLISSILSNELSDYLKSVQEKSSGLYTEIFVMDNKGLNVGQSAVTSDYWQGDEAKWKKSYGQGQGAVHIGEVEQDESTQLYQSQLSLPIIDPAKQTPIGAITIGINVEEL